MFVLNSGQWTLIGTRCEFETLQPPPLLCIQCQCIESLKKIKMGHILVVKTTKICPISKRLHHTLDKMYNTTNIMIYEFSASLCVGLNMKLLD